MKSSGKVLLGAGLFLVLALLGLLIATKALLGDRVATTDQTVPLGELERHIETTDFQRIQASGIWELEIIQGPQRTVRLVIPEYLEGDIRTSVTGAGLILGLKPGARMRPGQGAPRAIITMDGLGQGQVRRMRKQRREPANAGWLDPGSLTLGADPTSWAWRSSR